MMKRLFRHLSPFGLSLLALAIVATPSPAWAQHYPSNMIRMMVPSPAGTPPDIMGRIVANELSAERRLARHRREQARRDHDDRACRGAQAAGGRLHARLHRAAGVGGARASAQHGFPARRRFRAGDQARVGVSRPGRHIPPFRPSRWPSSSRLLKSQPDKLTFSSGGFGTPAHLAGEMFKLQTGVRATHVPYQGAAASHRRPAERHQPVSVHHAAAGPRLDRRRQIARAGGDRTGAAAGAQGRADGRRGRLSRT